MSDYFERLCRENPEFRSAEEALEPGYQFAVTIHDYPGGAPAPEEFRNQPE